MDKGLEKEFLSVLPRLRRFAYGLTGSLDRGDELVQATCERAISRIETWQAGTRLDSWMFRIARNIYFNWLRAEKVRSDHLKVVEFGDNPTSFDGARAAEAHVSLAALRRDVARLPEEQRAILLLVCVEGLTYREVADLLEVPIGTVTSRLARARIALKDMMEGPRLDEGAKDES